MAESTVKELRLRFSATDVNAGATMDKLDRQLGKLGGGDAGVIDTLKGTFGGRGPVKDIIEILRGGGAVVGLSLVATTIKEIADGAREAAAEFHKVNGDSGAAVEKMIGALPIIGRFFEAGRAVRELFTGEAAAAARVTKEAERANQFIDAQQAGLRVTTDALNDIEAIVGRITQRMDRLLPEPDRSFMAVSRSMMADVDSLAAVSEKAAKDRLASTADELKRLRDELKQIAIPDISASPEATEEQRRGPGGSQIAAMEAMHEQTVQANALAIAEVEKRNRRIKELEQQQAVDLAAINAGALQGMIEAVSVGMDERRRVLQDFTQGATEDLRHSFDNFDKEMAARVDRIMRQQAAAEIAAAGRSVEFRRGLNELNRLLRPEQPTRSGPPSLTESRFLTGQAEAARDQSQPIVNQLGRMSAEANRKYDEMIELLGTIAQQSPILSQFAPLFTKP